MREFNGGEVKCFTKFVDRESSIVLVCGVAGGDRFTVEVGSDGEHYPLRLEVETWRKIEFHNVYSMSGETYIDSATVHSEIAPAFEITGADGAYVLYERRAVQVLKSSLTVKYIGLYDASSPSKMAKWPDDFSPEKLETSPNQQKPTDEELNDYAYTGTDAALIAKKEAATNAITAKAQLWFNRITTDAITRAQAWFASAGVGTGNSLLAVQYYHPKLSNQGSDGQTSFYPAGINVNLAAPGSGRTNHGDPNRATWENWQGFNLGSTTVVFKNYGTPKRLRTVCRHEIGHATRSAFPRTLFGTGDHSSEGLMTPTGDSPYFSPIDCSKLRGLI
ncbi:hypothetical protein QA601_03015 [Chitinispirillales bacterium ANBcel5]|uniref:hypothetical protein n=1 Tax=Cellulosispirillum alkaliphilum TaxID=3039283 RepID=UPI002A500446|nr:hypothetical protein [Chitinispirillales bacterium ANBcel5]